MESNSKSAEVERKFLAASSRRRSTFSFSSAAAGVARAGRIVNSNIAINARTTDLLTLCMDFLILLDVMSNLLGADQMRNRASCSQWLAQTFHVQLPCASFAVSQCVTKTASPVTGSMALCRAFFTTRLEALVLRSRFTSEACTVIISP